jgi:hypothetical protein
MSPPPKLSRRSVTLGGIAVAAAAVVGGAIYEVPRLFKHRASGEYADLVNRLDDPDAAATVGKSIETDLRAQLKKRTLPDILANDAAAGKLVEADGWVLPATLAAICAMAAQTG